MSHIHTMSIYLLMNFCLLTVKKSAVVLRGGIAKSCSVLKNLRTVKLFSTVGALTALAAVCGGAGSWAFPGALFVIAVPVSTLSLHCTSL